MVAALVGSHPWTLLANSPLSFGTQTMFYEKELSWTDPIVAESCIIDMTINLKMLGGRKSGFICSQQVRNLSDRFSPDDLIEYSSWRDFICN
jgi:hypothetical protein